METRTSDTGPRRTAFVFLYAVCVLAAITVLVAGERASMRDPIEFTKRSLFHDHAFYAALSGLNYGRHYVSALIMEINQHQPVPVPPDPDTRPRALGLSKWPTTYLIEDWAGGGITGPDCSGRDPITTNFVYGTVTMPGIRDPRVRTRFTLDLNENLAKNYWFYSWMPLPPSMLTECVPSAYADAGADPPNGILYDITSTGFAEVFNPSPAPGAWVQVAQKEMHFSFTVINRDVGITPPMGLDLQLITRNIEARPDGAR